MQTVVGVRFKQAGKVYYFGTGGMDLKYGDEVIAETVRGLEYGKVLLPPREMEDAKVTLPSGPSSAWPVTRIGRRWLKIRRRKRKPSPFAAKKLPSMVSP